MLLSFELSASDEGHFWKQDGSPRSTKSKPLINVQRDNESIPTEAVKAVKPLLWNLFTESSLVAMLIQQRKNTQLTRIMSGTGLVLLPSSFFASSISHVTHPR